MPSPPNTLFIYTRNYTENPQLVTFKNVVEVLDRIASRKKYYRRRRDEEARGGYSWIYIIIQFLTAPSQQACREGWDGKVRSRTVCLESECVLYIFLKKKRTNKPKGKKKKKKKIVKFILHFLLVVCFFNCYRNARVFFSVVRKLFCHGSIGELGKPW